MVCMVVMTLCEQRHVGGGGGCWVRAFWLGAKVLERRAVCLSSTPCATATSLTLPHHSDERTKQAPHIILLLLLAIKINN
jgi:hypothetical protein